MRYYPIILLLACAISACSPGGETIGGKAYPQTLVRTKNLSFALDETASFSPFTLQYLDDGGQPYLLTSNKNTLTIDVFDAQSGKLATKLHLNDSTRQYASDLHGFWAVSRDSIYIYTEKEVV